ncbi:MAG: chemotaxis protein CheA [Fibrobacteria bacterium]
METILRDFLTEAGEAMDRFDSLLLSLERDPSDQESLTGVFREVHTIKGSCGFLGFGKLESLSHAGENMLSLLRDGLLVADKDMVSCLLKLGDSLRQIMMTIERTGTEGEADFQFLVDELGRFRPRQEAAAQETAGQEPAAQDWGKGLVTERYFADEDAPQAIPESPAANQEMAATDEHAFLGGEKSSGSVSDKTIRVDVSLLDKLMNLVGELVLIRNQVLQYTQDSSERKMLVASQHLNLLTTELQEGVMKTRMQPIKNVCNRFPRVVRELAIQCAKPVRLEMEGGDTELDKTILEAIKDPLMHILRNSVDHGIETPAIRAALGKPPEALISIDAYHEGGQVIIEISDDGKGIDCERVGRKAVEKGLISVERLAKLNDAEIARLIFLPGFSTAEKITNVSGRGVGMDVVKSSVEKIGGTVDLSNRPGTGLTLRIKIPLTLAIIPALLVTTAGQRFAIPQINVLEVVRLKKDRPSRGVEWIQGYPVYRLRGDLLPLLRLDMHFNLHPASGGQAAAIDDNFIVVLQADSDHFGVLVHGVQDTQEIVVKPLSKHLKRASMFAGATIMGDGKVTLILDVPGLAGCAELTRETDGDRSPLRTEQPGEKPPGLTESLIIVELPALGLVGIPIDQVSRLEKVPAANVESAADQEVVQMRGRIVPLLRMGAAFRSEVRTRHPVPDGIAGGFASPETLDVVVYDKDGVSAGLVVGRILDIVEAAMDMHLPPTRPGFRGSTLIKGKATEVLDLPSYLRLSLPSIFTRPQQPGLRPQASLSPAEEA